MNSLPHPPEWMADALCAQVDGDLWFPAKGESPRQAKRICSRCEVSSECLAYAQADPSLLGVWGGLSAHERELIRRRQRKEAA